MEQKVSLPLIIREAKTEDARSVAEIQVASWRLAYRGIFPDSYLDGMSPKKSEQKWVTWIDKNKDGSDTPQMFIAAQEGRVVGFCTTREPELPPPGYDCEIQAFYVSPELIGQGAGSKMFRVALNFFEVLGKKGLIIYTAAGNPFRRFYEKNGGILVETAKTFQIEGQSFPLISYGWKLPKVS